MNVIDSQLEYLNDIMKYVLSESNVFLLKYYIGGIISVIALLNIDIVSTRKIVIDSNSLNDFYILGSAVLALLIISYFYFSLVLDKYRDYLLSHRKLKYKYELTLHMLLSSGEKGSYQYYLEQSVKKPRNIENKELGEIKAIIEQLPNTEKYEFKEIAEYLLIHHHEGYSSEENSKQYRKYRAMAMLLILLTMCVKVAIFVLSGQG